MKTIIAVVQVQNEADIIESLCRYYCCFCDGVIVTDDMSSDNTIEILNHLVEEGLPVYITDDESIDHGLGSINARYQQIHLAVDKYNADIILPIDADEFLVNTNSGNPRLILETLDEKIEYHIPWHNYKCPKENDNNTVFFPSITDKYVDPPFSKAIISRFLVKQKEAFPETGCHSFFYPKEQQVTIDLNELCYNHYPFRNVYHFMLKTILSWTVRLMCPYHDGSILFGQSFHWKTFYEDIKKYGIISQDMLDKYSTYIDFSFTDDKEYDFKESIFDSSFCNDKLQLRYTNYKNINNNFMKILTTQLEKNLRNMPSWRPALERKISGEALGQANTTINNLNKYIKTLEKNINQGKLFSTFYFDTGRGFNEEENVHFNHFRETKYSYNIVDVPQNTKAIRFDPVEGIGCYIEKLNIIYENNIPLDYQILNGFRSENNGIIFTNNDPQILLNLEEKNVKTIIVYYNIWFFLL
jgi:hypothetical protein